MRSFSGNNGGYYDLTKATFIAISSINGSQGTDGSAQGVTFLVNNAVIAAVPEFHNFYGKPGHVLVTSDAAIDLSHTLVDSFVIKSTNALGTAFTVKTADTAGSATLNWIILFHTEHIRHFVLPTLAMQERYNYICAS